MAQIDIDIKWVLWAAIIILLVVIGYLGMKLYDEMQEEFPNETSRYCGKNIVPDTIVFGTSLSELEYGEYRTYNGIESQWKDGTPISTVPPDEEWDFDIKCSEQGDYLYCKDMYYAKTPIDSEDYSFGQTRIILVDLVLDKSQSTLSHFQAKDWEYTYHWVIEHPVVNGTCKEL